ncbi:RES domain-containing protein [Rothia nasimurium]
MVQEKRVCAQCVVEPYLAGVITASGDVQECDYCGNELPTMSIGEVAERFDVVIENFFDVTSLSDAVVIYERDPAGDAIADVVEMQLDAAGEVVEDVLEALTDIWSDHSSMESKYGDDPYFSENSHLGGSYSVEWRAMVESLRSEARLFNPKTSAVLERVFGPILSDKTRKGSGVIVDAGPGTACTTLFRARVFQSLEALERALHHPAREIGAPPPGVGRAGRMNAKGISVFYGATSANTAVAEVRPPVGSHVVVGQFTISRSLRLLDLNALADIVPAGVRSYFDPSTKDVVARHDFLRSLCDQLVMPVMPEFEDDGYLITQLIADFLATHSDLALDGIQFQSVQYGDASSERGQNVVLFNKASRAEGAGPTAADRVAYVSLYEQEDESEYWWPQITFIDPADWKNPPYWHHDRDERKAALTLDTQSLVIRKIEGVSYKSNTSKIHTDFAPSKAEM